jgi:hypothetical protein
MGLREVIFCRWELTQGVVSWVAWEGKVWLFIKVRRWDFFLKLRNNVFGGVGWGGWRKGVGIFPFVIW